MGRGSRGEARCGFAGSEDSSDPIVSVFSTRQQEARSRGQNGGAGWVFGAQGARRGLGAGRGPWRVLHEVALARGRRPGPRDEGGAGPACPAVAFVRPLTRCGAARSRTRGRRGGRVSVRTPWPPPHVKQRKGQLGPWVMAGGAVSTGVTTKEKAERCLRDRASGGSLFSPRAQCNGSPGSSCTVYINTRLRFHVCRRTRTLTSHWFLGTAKYA